MSNISRVIVAKLSGVYLRHDLNFSQHVDAIVATCQRFYLLAQLKKQGLGISSLDTIFKAIVLNEILYALLVYYGYLTEGKRVCCNECWIELLVEASFPITMIWNVLAETAVTVVTGGTLPQSPIYRKT